MGCNTRIKEQRLVFNSNNPGSSFSLNKSFDHTSDEIPEGRVKFIHTYGVTSQVSFLSNKNHPFTGLYKTGSVGIARLSLAANPKKISYTPGMALKFFVKGHPSLNIVVMNSLNGQDNNWNFFAHDFSNKIPSPSGFMLRILMKIFQLARKPANDLPVDHLAKINLDGSIVDSPYTPESLVLKPLPHVYALISPDSRKDFREHLEKLKPGTVLYNVYGLKNGREIKIGKLQTTSSMISSKYADKVLFFQHKR